MQVGGDDETSVASIEKDQIASPDRMDDPPFQGEIPAIQAMGEQSDFHAAREKAATFNVLSAQNKISPQMFGFAAAKDNQEGKLSDGDRSSGSGSGKMVRETSNADSAYQMQIDADNDISENGSGKIKIGAPSEVTSVASGKM